MSHFEVNSHREWECVVVCTKLVLIASVVDDDGDNDDNSNNIWYW